MSQSYRDILDEADRHFARAMAEQPQAFQCRLGCTLCCVGLFEIGAADVAVIASGLSELDPADRAVIIARAAANVAETDHPDLREAGAAEREEFFERTSDIPCPALDDRGGCSIYSHRPLVCRTFGVPIRNGEEYLGQECELNFTSSDPLEKERAAWDLLWEDAVGPEDEYTVPEAIVLAARLLRE